MAIKSLINGEESDTLSIDDRGLLYGDGLFETVAVQNKTLLCWDEHIDRLQKGCARLSLPIPDATQLKEEATRLITSNERSVIKIMITRGQGSRGYSFSECIEATRIVSLHPWPDHPKENANTGVRLRVCDYRYANNSVLAGVKHLNRLEQVMARMEWHDKTYAEGIVLDINNNVIEGTMSNIFYISKNLLCTPDLTHCGIEGVIRQKIIELATELKFELGIQKTSLESLLAAEEIFICNSTIGIWPVIGVDEQSYAVGDITKQIQQTLQQQNVIASLC